MNTLSAIKVLLVAVVIDDRVPQNQTKPWQRDLFDLESNCGCGTKHNQRNRGGKSHFSEKRQREQTKTASAAGRHEKHSFPGLADAGDFDTFISRQETKNLFQDLGRRRLKRRL